MKKLLIIALMLPMALHAGDKEIPVSIDPRVELCSIAFRLAGADEYSTKENSIYVEDIEKHFTPYRNDTLIRYVKYLRERTAIGYDAVISMAISLQGKDGKYSLPATQQALEILYDNSGRWNKWNAPEFVRLLNEFYHKSEFKSFLKEHKKYYSMLEQQFRDEVNFNRKWYSDFYGMKNEEDFHIIIAPGCGKSNYGPHTYDATGKKNVYAVLGVFNFEEDGKPTFSSQKEIVIHEFNHSYINPLTDITSLAEKLKNSGEKIMEVVGEDMRMQAYGDFKTVINESLVRAAVIRYMRDNGYTEKDIQKEIVSQKSLAYYWIDGLDSLYGEYDSHRDKYPDMMSFYPHIEKYFEKTARDITLMKDEFYEHAPHVQVSPSLDGRQDVSPATKFIEVKTSCPVNKNAGVVWMLVRKGGEDSFASVTIKGNDTVIFYLKLSPNTEYHFHIRGFLPATEEGYFIKPQDIRFRTGE